MAVRLNPSHAMPSRGNNHHTRVCIPKRVNDRTPVRQYGVHPSLHSSSLSQKTSHDIPNKQVVPKIERVMKAKHKRDESLLDSRIPKAEEIPNNPRLLKELGEAYYAQSQEQEAHEISELCMDMFRDSLIKEKKSP